MFERIFYLRSLCVLWLSATTVAAQSNQPIDIDAPTSLGTSSSQRPVVPTGPGRPDQGRLAQRVPVAPASPVRPDPVVVPEVPNELAIEAESD